MLTGSNGLNKSVVLKTTIKKRIFDVSKTHITLAFTLRRRWSSYAGYAAIAATAPEKESTKDAITEPTVQASSLFPTDHKVVITSHGELVPFEKKHTFPRKSVVK